MSDERRRTLRRVDVLGIVGLLLVSCGAEAPPAAGPSPRSAIDEPAVGEVLDTGAVEPGAAPAPENAPSAPSADRSAPGVDAITPQNAPAPGRQALDQPAVWPAPDVVFATPEEAAADFVSRLLISDGDPALGEFQPGDARSGEIAVLFAGETGDLDPPQVKGTLLMRQIGPTDGWYVIAATSDGAVIDTPAALDELEAGTVTVAGEGRGFESTLVVTAFPQGDDSAPFDQQIGAGGPFGDNEPFSVDLDLSGALPGDVVAILVRGDTGLGSDPSTFAAIPVVIASAPTDTLPPTK